MKTKMFMCACVLIMFVCGCASIVAKPKTISVKYAWTEPTSGNKVVSYNAYLKVDNGKWKRVVTTKLNQCAIPCIVGKVNVVRVAGVDALNREGAMSQPSDPHTPRVSATVPVQSIKW